MKVYELIQELTNYDANDEIVFNVAIEGFDVCENEEELKEIADEDGSIIIEIDEDVDFYESKRVKGSFWDNKPGTVTLYLK